MWATHKYNVEYDARGGTNAPDVQTGVKYDELLTISSRVPTYDGYYFLGWAKTADTLIVSCSPNAKVTALTSENAATVCLYAVWVADPYSIVYYANGGSSAPAAQNGVGYAESKDLSADTPTWEGHSFLGWATDPNATEILYVPGASVQYIIADKDKQLKLYAVWTTNTYTIVYDANQGVDAPAERAGVLYGTSISLSDQIPNRDEFTFLGWAKTADAKNAEFTASAEVSNLVSDNGGSITLYAVWRAMHYTIIYDANGGSGAPEAEMNVAFDTPITISSVELTRVGYTYKGGWSTKIDAKTVEFPKGQDVQIPVYAADRIVTLYAVWEPISYKIIFKANGGENAPAAQENLLYNEEYSLTTALPVRIGHTCVGWSRDPQVVDSTSEFTPGQKISRLAAENEITLYAVWRADRFTVVYGANGGSNAPASQVFTYNVAAKITAPSPSRIGYNFQGWSRSTTGGVQYTAGQELTVSQVNILYGYKNNQNTVTLNSVWAADRFSIVYNANGGTNAPSLQSFAYDSSGSITSSKPTKTGYVFQGWAKTSSGSAQYTAGQSISASTVNSLYGNRDSNKQVTFFAVWTKDTFSIQYNANGGEDTPSKTSCTYNTQSSITTSIPTR